MHTPSPHQRKLYLHKKKKYLHYLGQNITSFASSINISFQRENAYSGNQDFYTKEVLKVKVHRSRLQPQLFWWRNSILSCCQRYVLHHGSAGTKPCRCTGKKRTITTSVVSSQSNIYVKIKQAKKLVNKIFHKIHMHALLGVTIGLCS